MAVTLGRFSGLATMLRENSLLPKASATDWSLTAMSRTACSAAGRCGPHWALTCGQELLPACCRRRAASASSLTGSAAAERLRRPRRPRRWQTTCAAAPACRPAVLAADWPPAGASPGPPAATTCCTTCCTTTGATGPPCTASISASSSGSCGWIAALQLRHRLAKTLDGKEGGRQRHLLWPAAGSFWHRVSPGRSSSSRGSSVICSIMTPRRCSTTWWQNSLQAGAAGHQAWISAKPWRPGSWRPGHPPVRPRLGH